MQISILIPAFDESRTIKAVIQAAKASSLGEILVVSDGSSDNTAQVAREAGANVLELKQNRGKAGAVAAGLEILECEIVILLDGDLVDLKAEHIKALVEPVMNGEVDTTVGIFAGGRGRTDLAQRLTPYLSGQRAIRKDFLQNIPNLAKQNYALEMAITDEINRRGLKMKYVTLQGVSQIMKEEKRGFFKGFIHRLQMYWQILSFAFKRGR